jgi:hypothetical protein
MIYEREVQERSVTTEMQQVLEVRLYDILRPCMAIIMYFSALCSVQTRPVFCLTLLLEKKQFDI